MLIQSYLHGHASCVRLASTRARTSNRTSFTRLRKNSHILAAWITTSCKDEGTSMSILGTQADLGCDLNSILQVGILAILLVGLRFGRIKTPNALRKHRAFMTSAVLLDFAGFVYVMAPSLLSFLSLSPVHYFSLWGLTSIPHGILGGTTLTIGTLFAINHIPKRNLRGWMQATFLMWLASALLGVVLYMQMAGFI